jgi:hypothetical protein
MSSAADLYRRAWRVVVDVAPALPVPANGSEVQHLLAAVGRRSV